MFFSRNGKDYSQLYGPALASVIREHVQCQAVILDGEVVVWDSFNNRLAPFGSNKTVAIQGRH